MASHPLSSKERLGNRRALLPAKYRDHITSFEEPASFEKSNRNLVNYKRCAKSRCERQKAADLRRSDKDLTMDRANGIRFQSSCIAGRHAPKAKSSYFRQQGVQVQRISNDNLNGYHVVPNHVHSESNGFPGIEDSLYTSNDMKYFSGDDKENNFLTLESDSEDADQLTFALSDPLSEAEVDSQRQCFDLSLDSDSDSEMEEFEDTLELQLDDCDDGDDLYCSIQEQQCENNTKPSSDLLVCKIPTLSLNNLTDLDESNDIYMDLPSHDDLSSATVEVLAVSREAMQDHDVKDVTTTSSIFMVDQLCAATAICYAPSQNVTNENPASPLNVTIKKDLLDECKQQCICDSSETHGSIDVRENTSKCVASAAVLPEEVHNLPMTMENIENTLDQATPKAGQTHEEVFMEALENYKKSGGHDTSLEKFENKNFTIQHESLSPNYQPSSIHAVLSCKNKSGRHKKVRNMRRDRRNYHSERAKQQIHPSIKDMNSMEDIPSSVVTMCQRTVKTNGGSGDTALHKACRNGRSDMALYYILDGTIDINTQDYAGWSALHEACNKGCDDIVRMLVKHGANVNLSSHDGTRPIHDAIEGNSLEIVKLLIESGADISVEREGKTLINIAEEHGFKDIIDYLEEQCKNSQYTKEQFDVQLQLAVDASKLNFSLGYNLDKFSLGEELDSPLFYIVPTIESSEGPLLPLYNIAVPHKDSLRLSCSSYS